MAQAYAVTNMLAGLSSSAFSLASSGSNLARLNDSRMNALASGSSVASGDTIKVDLGSAKSVGGVALLNHNLASFGGSVTAQVQGADDSGFTTNVVTAKDTTTLNLTAPFHKDHVLQCAASSRRWWRIVLSWTGTKQLTLGELFFYTSSTQLTRMDVYGPSGRGERINVKQVQSEYLETRAYQLAGPQRTRRLDYEDHTEAEAEELAALWRAVKGPCTPFLWIESYEAVSTAAAAAQQECIYGKLGVTDFFTAFVDYSRFRPPGLFITSVGREAGA